MIAARAVQLSGSEVHLLHSEAVGDDFEISVFAPPPGVEGPLPIVYFTDANIGVGMAANIVNLLQLGAEIPPVRLVCIGYPIGDDLTQWARLRTRDFTATDDAALESGLAAMAGVEVRGGGADAFLEFLTGELRPWVESNYEVTDDSTLIGHSDGGLFATYTLLHRPSSFRRYVIGSPSLCWNRNVSTAYEAQYAETHDDLDATVFLCAGADEEVLPPALPALAVEQLRGADTAELTRRLGTSLASRGYPSLRLTTRIFPEETHFTILPILGGQGLRAVFAAERARE